MWLRLTEIHTGDVMVNMAVVRFVERSSPGSRLYFGNDPSIDSNDYLDISQSLEEIEKMIKNYDVIVTSVEGPQDIAAMPGQGSPT
jgi:hypothetical protein